MVGNGEGRVFFNLDPYNMHILYVTNDWYESAVHCNLVLAISRCRADIRVSVYVPLKVYETAGVDKDLPDNVRVYTSFVLRNCHKFLYKSKLRVLLKDVQETIPDMHTVDLTHSATQCLGGGLALELKKKMGIPYITAVRNTDVNVYYRFLIWQRGVFQKILDHADRILFISEVYKQYFLNNYMPGQKKRSVIAKSEMLQNGIDSIYLSNREYSHRICPERLVFIGNFVENKNIHGVIEAVKLLREKGYNLTFTAIGQKADDLTPYNKLMNEYQRRYEWVELRSRMSKQELVEHLKDYDIFTMVSHHETFGLVYIEALSQGLPILYTEGQGIDRYFEEGTVGFHAKSGSVRDIADKLEQIIKNYSKQVEYIKQLSLDEFRWSEISKKYIELYNKVKPLLK